MKHSRNYEAVYFEFPENCVKEELWKKNIELCKTCSSFYQVDFDDISPATISLVGGLVAINFIFPEISRANALVPPTPLGEGLKPGMVHVGVGQLATWCDPALASRFPT